jgi:hypothetical protein
MIVMEKKIGSAIGFKNMTFASAVSCMENGFSTCRIG